MDKIKELKNFKKICQVLIFLLISLIIWVTNTQAATYYISPSGDDTKDGQTEATAWKTFSKAFSTMKGGDELILLDGTYSNAAGTGYISYLGVNSAQPPSGTGLNNMTIVRAMNPGKVKIIGGLFLGRSFRKDSYIKIQGITFEGLSHLYNTSYITIKDCGFYDYTMKGYPFGIGTNDHTQGNSYNLIEDSWIWGKGRIIAINYRADNNVWRRVIIRGDGCNAPGCIGPPNSSVNPNVGITVYDSSHVSLQNVIVADRILNGGTPYADFATAQHTEGAYLQGPNEWLGTISIAAPDWGYYFEADYANDNTVTIKNAVAWDSGVVGFGIGRDAKNILLENITSGYSRWDNIRIPEGVTGIIRNVISYKAGGAGIYSLLQPSYVNVYGSQRSATCSVGCYDTNPLADGDPPSLKYLLRIEDGSFLKGKGFNGADIGANIVYRYGVDGSRYGEPNYNTLTSNPLWPWPNEERIKQEMCDATYLEAAGRTGDNTPKWCATNKTLTQYIWEYLGNPCPPEICNYAKPSPPRNLRIIQ